MKNRTLTENNLTKKQSISIVVVCLAIFFALLVLVETNHASLIDDPIRNAVINARNPWLTAIMKSVTFVGDWHTITAFCVILIIIKKTRKICGWPLGIGTLLVSLGNKGIKALVLRPRPDIEMFLIEQDGWSFPSGHSITGMFFFGMLIWYIQRNMKNRTAANVITVIFAFLILLIGTSRVYLGVHYPTDILAGWSLAIVSIIIATEIIKKLEKRNK